VLLALMVSGCATIPIPPTLTPIPPTATALPETVRVGFYAAAQVEIITPTGRAIYIDVTTTSKLNKEPTPDDILLTTHTHADHLYKPFVEGFPGQQLYATGGKIELPDVTITSIPSAHNEGDEMKAEGASNYIYLIETGGLRIAHFGDIGQDALTVEQLATLGEIDLAITQISNGFSNMNSSNQKGLNLMKQVKPHLILLTHFDSGTLDQLVQEWPNGYFLAKGPAILSNDKIPDGTGLFFMGTGAIAYGTVYSLQEWK
jgi:hypothetical protein